MSQPEQPEATGTDHRYRWLLWAVVALLILGIFAFLAKGADKPADPHFEGAGFGEIAFRVTRAGDTAATAATRCALLAETDAQRARGLMGQRSLDPYDAMVFRFERQDDHGGFWMHNVPVPLSVAWFDGDGRFVASADMDVCGDAADCARRTASPHRPYRYALEVLEGGLDRLDIGPGAVLDLGGGCPDR